MTNLTEQDLKRIDYIEHYLAQLNTLLPNAPAFDLTQPIDTTEGEPIETEQRFDISIYQNPIDRGNHGLQISAPSDRIFTKEYVEKIKKAIKQYLSTNKF